MGARYMIKKVYPNTLSLSQSSSKFVGTNDDKYDKYNDNGSVLISPSCSKTSDDNNNQYKESTALTVWKKSLLLNCKGFTVFDGKGNLVFRVDNYLAANEGEIVLMDAAGKPLFTIRRKWLSWGENWLLYEGEAESNPKYLVQKQRNLLTNYSKTTMGSLARVFSLGSSRDQEMNQIHMKKKKSFSDLSKINWCKKSTNTINTSSSNSGRSSHRSMLYEIEGSYPQQNVVMYDNKMQRVAEMRNKQTATGVALGGDVFKLIIVRPDAIDTALGMAIVILLHQMFGSSS